MHEFCVNSIHELISLNRYKEKNVDNHARLPREQLLNSW